MEIEEHCQTCFEKFGKEFREVHKWLDDFIDKQGVDENGIGYMFTGYSRMKHRRMRHHIEGVWECRRLFGEEAARAAEYHIKQDFFGYLPHRSDYYRKEFWEEMAERERLYGDKG